MLRAVLACLLLLLAAAPAADAKPGPISAGAAFDLPTMKRCVKAHALSLRLSVVPGVTWAEAVVTVAGKRFRTVKRPGPFRLTGLPAGRYRLSITATTRDGRTVTASRTYRACGKEPVITVPPGPPPTSLVTTDLKVGTGPAVGARSSVTVHYVLVAFSTGEELDSSFDRHEPFSFRLGQGDVIPGFEQGIAGMRVGGRRQVIIPPGLAYGAEGAGPIAGDETLIFVIDLLAFRR